MDALPPDPVASYDDLSVGLQRVRLEAGVSYRELHRRIARDRRRRGIPEVPAYDTVYRCLQIGRTRLDVDLVLDIVRALGADGGGDQRLASGLGGCCSTAAGGAAPAGPPRCGTSGRRTRSGWSGVARSWPGCWTDPDDGW